MGQALINPKMLTWSRNREGLSVEQMSIKFKKSQEMILEWEQGVSKLTFNQAMEWARYTHTPFGYLYLKNPPVETINIPDRRTIDGAKKNISPELRDTINDVLIKQEWYKDYLIKNDLITESVVGNFTLQDNYNKVVSDIRKKLAIEIPPTKGKWDDLFRDIIKKIESLGVLVMRNGIVKNNTSRPLSVEDFRGFAIYDEIAPVIFINTNDAKSAQLFTLIHELAHLWIGSSAISNLTNINDNDNEETFCNAVAAEYLVPSDLFKNKWESLSPDNIEECALELSKYFRVSKWVIARRALTLSLISKQEYQEYINIINDKVKSSTNGSGNYNKMQKARVSNTLARAVTSEALNSRILLSDAYDLIGIKPSNLASFAEKELNN
ncbi:ImmA/IrrE family metallo-endopeptidase [Entomomonas moraniae]|uniref:ImmA/IrrE family metallo-endopeptidase n=1 Tax=Entomomonas moraniae TaxID=2213226 RepID=A0A3S9XDZ9_9GAMM|nr:ImmA/IrrE family metallo-endopeptidase [Entomomonas moraniae]AZS50675.1 ImmA/IrrE family metallo-endopeptidase [Entomomonas moraniae]